MSLGSAALCIKNPHKKSLVNLREKISVCKSNGIREYISQLSLSLCACISIKTQASKRFYPWRRAPVVYNSHNITPIQEQECSIALCALVMHQLLVQQYSAFLVTLLAMIEHFWCLVTFSSNILQFW